MNSKLRNGRKLSREFKKNIRKGASILLSMAMVAGSVSLSDVSAVTVSAAEKSTAVNAATGSYVMGKDGKINSSTVFDTKTGYGFSDFEYPDAAKDWVGAVYYPREERVTTGKASYVSDGEGYLAIESKVWTETEKTGYGTFTYENTSTLDFALDNADYKISVELVNPTDKELTVSLEAENITKASGVKVAAGKTVTQDITACLVDGVLNIKFLETSASATSESDAAVGKVYVSKVSISKAAEKTAGEKPTIFIASDSTVQTYESNYYPQTGWGQTLHNFFGDFVEERECKDCEYSQAQTYETVNAIVENRAIGGRSSKSFIEEGKFDDLLEDVKPGDYVLVQWGHNDATTSRPNRYVSPEDFGYWMQYYVDGVTQRGATPILVTPVARYSYTTNEDGTLKSFVGNFEKYGDVMRKMAKEQNIPIVDLTARSTALCNEFGIEGAKSLFLMVEAGDYPEGAYAGGANDSTHLQYYGAYKFAQCVAEGIVDYANEGATDALDALAALVVNKVPTKEPGKVGNLASTTVGASSVGMSWDAEDDSELYYIYRTVLEDGQTIDDVDFSNAEKYSVSSKNKYTDTACQAGVTYVYAVRGFNPKGLGELSNKIQVTTKTAGWKFDINGDKNSIAKADGPTESGWIGIGADKYDKSVGYGWITVPGAGRDRGVQDNDSYSEMGRDFTMGDGEFAVDLPNGDYEVTCYGGDILPGTSSTKSSYSAEGKSIGSISVKQGVASATGTVRVEDGQLNLTVGGTNKYLNGFTITSILNAPSGLVAFEKAVKGSSMSFLLGFNTVDEAVSYNVYRKSTSDDSFKVIKSFTTEDLKNDENGCKSMTVALGESYEYYMTCITADGTESARSDIATVTALSEDVKAPAAPTNVVCVDPAASTVGVRQTITISWDAAAVENPDSGKVIKYIIYRSAKAENEKGYKGFEKVGESETTTFTDTYYDLDTNISYYYKVAALNAGGLGEQSAVCRTPVTGTLTQQNLEKYSDRALVAVNLAGEKGADTLISATDSEGNTLTNGVYLSWRSFGADFDGNNNLTTTFTVYRDGSVIASDIKVTNLVDEGGTSASTYKVVGSNDSAIGVNAVDTKCWEHQYLELSLFAPADETMPEYNGEVTTCDYSANDMSLGDLDGDGVLELIVKWYPSNAKDNSGYGFTGKTFLDAYDVNWATGAVSLLYRIDMGINIRSGAHYTQFQVWDYDGDGKAEIAVKTAPGTTVLRPTDGTANTLVEKEWIDVASSTLPTETISAANDYRNSSGYVLSGPEYLTMFNGEDGSILDTTAFVPERGNVGAWGDAYGNRVDRFLSATAYLDGEKPYAVFSRGYYTRTCLTAYYVNDEGKLDVYWAFDTNEAGSEYEAQGNHGLSVNDIDNDGKDEIIYGSLTIDHDGTVKYSTGLGHGDAMHVSDWVSWNDGLEIMDVHEHDDAAYHVEIHDAETGEILMGYYTGKDTGRGVAADIDPTSLGGEWWSIASPTYEGNDEPSWDSTDGEVYSTQSKLGALIKLADNTPASNASIFWDGDLLSEIQDHTFNKDAYMPTGVKIYKWDYENSRQGDLLSSTEIWSGNGTKGNLGIIADFLGDWREEIIARCADNKNNVRIYTTTIQTDYVVPCLLENLAYREGVAWENVGYNQPANLSYLLSEGLITSQLMAGQITKKSAEIAFTEASDGKYGHEVTGYEIYRAEGDGEFELIDTISKDKLVEYVPGKVEPEEPEEVILYSQDFESGESDFTYYAEDFVSLAADTASVNPNKSSYVLSVGQDGRDRRVQSPALGVKDDATVELELRIDAPYKAKTSYFSLLGAANSDKANSEWLQSNAQILTIEATAGASDNTTWKSILLNGVDVTDALAADVSESGTGKTATTGWIKIKAGLDFTNKKADVIISKAADDSVLYSAEVAFVNEVSGLEHIFLSSNKNGGRSFIDNIKIVDGIADTLAEYVSANQPAVISMPVTAGTTNEFSASQESTTAESAAEATTEAAKTENDTTVESNAADKTTDAAPGNNTKVDTEKVSSEAEEQVTSKAAEETTDAAVEVSEPEKATTTDAAEPSAAENSSEESDAAEEATTVDATKPGETEDASESGAQENTATNDAEETITDNTSESAEADENTADAAAGSAEADENTADAAAGSAEADENTTDAAAGSAEADEDVTAESTESETLTIALNNVRAVMASENENADTVKYYSYVDKTTKPDTTYRYKIAAVVDGKTSFMSRAVEIHTLVDIKSVDVDAIVINDLIQDQVFADGQTLSDLLPSQVKVIDSNDNEAMANIKWDVTNVDIKAVGEYEIIGIIAGWDEPVVKKVNVIENRLTGYVAFDDVIVIVGNKPTLPSKITATFLNGQSVTSDVTWNTDLLDINTIGDYNLTGTSTLITDAKLVVRVVDNYIVSLYTRYCEVNLGDADYKLPSDVNAVWADGTTSYVSAEWENTSVDVSTLGTTALSGTVEGFDKAAQLQVMVKYPVAKRFDFGIEGSAVEDGWIGVAANVKTGKKTVDELKITYSENTGYGFLDGSKVFEGRDDRLYKAGGQLADSVYRDYIIPDGNTFRVDVPNGKYVVEIVSGHGNKGNNTVKADVNGTSISVKNGAQDYTIGEVAADVTDGHIDIKFTGTLCRTCAIVVRTVSVDGKDEPEEPSTEEPTTEEPTQPSTEEPTQPSTEKPSTEEPTQPSTEKPSTEAPTQPSTEEPTQPTTEKPSTEAPTQPTTEKPSTETPTQPTTEEPSTEAPTQEPTTEAPADDDEPAEVPGEGVTEASSEASVKVPDKTAGETKAQTSTQQAPAPTQQAQKAQKETTTKAPSKNIEYRGEAGKLSDDVINDIVKQKLGVKSAADVVDYLAKMITEDKGANTLLPDVDVDNTEVIDFVVKFKNSDGNWVEADEEALSEGVDVFIPYPANTSKDGFEFVVGHLIMTGDKAGTMEYFKPENTDEGLKIHITSASPFVIGWTIIHNDEQPTTEAPTQPATEATTANSETSQQTDNAATSAAQENVSTGSGITTVIVVLVIIMVIALAGIAVAMVYKKKNGKKNN